MAIVPQGVAGDRLPWDRAGQGWGEGGTSLLNLVSAVDVLAFGGISGPRFPGGPRLEALGASMLSKRYARFRWGAVLASCRMLPEGCRNGLHPGGPPRNRLAGTMHTPTAQVWWCPTYSSPAQPPPPRHGAFPPQKVNKQVGTRTQKYQPGYSLSLDGSPPPPGILLQPLWCTPPPLACHYSASGAVVAC